MLLQAFIPIHSSRSHVPPSQREKGVAGGSEGVAGLMVGVSVVGTQSLSKDLMAHRGEEKKLHLFALPTHTPFFLALVNSPLCVCVCQFAFVCVFGAAVVTCTCWVSTPLDGNRWPGLR